MKPEIKIPTPWTQIPEADDTPTVPGLSSEILAERARVARLRKALDTKRANARAAKEILFPVREPLLADEIEFVFAWLVK